MDEPLPSVLIFAIVVVILVVVIAMAWNFMKIVFEFLYSIGATAVLPLGERGYVAIVTVLIVFIIVTALYLLLGWLPRIIRRGGT